MRGDVGRLIGRKGGMNAALHAVTDANGRPGASFKTGGQVSDYGRRRRAWSPPTADLPGDEHTFTATSPGYSPLRQDHLIAAMGMMQNRTLHATAYPLIL